MKQNIRVKEDLTQATTEERGHRMVMAKVKTMTEVENCHQIKAQFL